MKDKRGRPMQYKSNHNLPVTLQHVRQMIYALHPPLSFIPANLGGLVGGCSLEIPTHLQFIPLFGQNSQLNFQCFDINLLIKLILLLATY